MDRPIHRRLRQICCGASQELIRSASDTAADEQISAFLSPCRHSPNRPNASRVARCRSATQIDSHLSTPRSAASAHSARWARYLSARAGPSAIDHNARRCSASATSTADARTGAQRFDAASGRARTERGRRRSHCSARQPCWADSTAKNDCSAAPVEPDAASASVDHTPVRRNRASSSSRCPVTSAAVSSRVKCFGGGCCTAQD